MYTSLVLIALTGSSLFAAIPVSVEFKTDYVTARKMGMNDHKPLAVFIGSGPKGWEQRTKEGQLSQDAQHTLQANYVCVYLDTASAEGQRLAADFEMKEGLVISDARGENQAFRHAGNLSNSDLESQLKKFSEPNRVAVRTETNAREDVRFFPSQPAAAPAVQFSTPAPQYYAPAYSSIPSSGYCPSCSSGSRR